MLLKRLMLPGLRAAPGGEDGRGLLLAEAGPGFRLEPASPWRSFSSSA